MEHGQRPDHRPRADRDREQPAGAVRARVGSPALRAALMVLGAVGAVLLGPGAVVTAQAAAPAVRTARLTVAPAVRTAPLTVASLTFARGVAGTTEARRSAGPSGRRVHSPRAAGPAGRIPPSAWSEPRLAHPEVVTVSDAARSLVLNQRRDYVLRCPAGPTRLRGKLSVWGGHDVVLQDCDLHVTHDWVAYFHDQTGTLWIHDVHFGGERLTGGIQLQEPRATVVLRDVLFDKVYGSYRTNHAELVQTWAGPRRLLIDGLTGADAYQGLFLLPNQWFRGPAPTVFDLRHIDIDNRQGAYALWLGDVDGRIGTWNVQDVYVNPNPSRTWRGWWLWPQPSAGGGAWAGVNAGTPPGGHYVRAARSGARGVDEGAPPPPLRGERA